MIPAAFEYARAESVDHAIELLSSNEDAKILAGGHSLLPLMRLRLARPSMLVDIGRVPDLSGIRADGDSVVIGALTRHHDVANSEVLQELCPIVAHTAGEIGDPQVRHMGTIGGSVAHADPASDMPAVLVALGAEMVVRGAGGAARTVAAGGLLQGSVHARPGGERGADRDPRAGDPSRRLELHQVPSPGAGLGARRAWRRSRATEARTSRSRTWARRRCGQRASRRRSAGGGSRRPPPHAPTRASAPPSDAFGSAEYRRELAKVLVRRALEEALAG